MRQFHTGSHHTPAFCNVSAETVFVIAFNYLIVLNFIINRYYCQAVFAAAANASECLGMYSFSRRLCAGELYKQSVVFIYKRIQLLSVPA